jgi:hypothetical protein
MSSHNPHNLAVGQELWFEPRSSGLRNGEGSVVTIATVGRTWATLSKRHDGGARQMRIDLKSLVADGAGWNSPGTCHMNRAEHLREKYRLRLWQDLNAGLRNIPSYSTPATVSTGELLEVMRLLNLPIPKEQT